MNLWKTIHRKLIDEPIERLVGWPQFTNGSLFEKNTSDGPVSSNATGADGWLSIEEEALMTNMYGTAYMWENSDQLCDDDGLGSK